MNDLSHDLITQRRSLADFADSLSPEQLSRNSLVPTWTVRDVFAHVAMGVDGQALFKFLGALLRERSFERAADRTTFAMARKPIPELASLLRRRADKNLSIPGLGPLCAAAEFRIHELDMRQPLGLPRPMEEARLRSLLDFTVTKHPPALTRTAWWMGLRLEATDLDWSTGSGPLVRGTGDLLLLALAGRGRIVSLLQGEGTPVLAERIAVPGA